MLCVNNSAELLTNFWKILQKCYRSNYLNPETVCRPGLPVPLGELTHYTQRKVFCFSCVHPLLLTSTSTVNKLTTSPVTRLCPTEAQLRRWQMTRFRIQIANLYIGTCTRIFCIKLTAAFKWTTRSLLCKPFMATNFRTLFVNRSLRNVFRYFHAGYCQNTWADAT